MTVFQTIAILLTFAALGAYVNLRFFKLPATIGLMTFAVLLSSSAIGLSRIGFVNLTALSDFVAHINFSDILLHGMLSFLLFAGALHVDLSDLKKHRVTVASLATGGVIIATLVTGSLVWWVAQLLSIPLTYLEALIFGALIAPTDPVAVLGILKETTISKSLRIKIGGESLLNDGVGVVLFLALLGMTQLGPTEAFEPHHLAMLLIWEGVGSVVLGLTLGWLTFRMLRDIDDYKVEVMLTLALVTGGYSLAEVIGISAPITIVVAGLFMGNHGRIFGMSDQTRQHLDIFWELLDEILNTVLFMLIGLEMIVVAITPEHMVMGIAAIVATLIGRYISVAIPMGAIRVSGYRFDKNTLTLLTWGGLRGGISIALALSLPPSTTKELILGMTYIVVFFSVLFQGTTFRYVVRSLVKKRT